MTAITDETAGAGRRRASLIAGLNSLIDFLDALDALDVTDDEEGIPERVTIQLPAPGDRGHEGKQAWLDRVAAAWHTEVRPDGMGGRFAEKQFGSVRLLASVAHPGRGVFEYKDRARARQAATLQAANGMGATA